MAAAPTLVDDEVAASNVGDLVEDIVQATSRRHDPVAVIGSKLGEGLQGAQARSALHPNAVQISQHASSTRQPQSSVLGQPQKVGLILKMQPKIGDVQARLLLLPMF